MRIVQGGIGAFNALAYGVPDQGTLAYFNTQLSGIQNLVGEYGNMFKNAISETYDRFLSNEAIQAARLALTYSNTIENLNAIRQFTLMEEIQSAQSEMQRWIMSNPYVREIYHDQRCDGYSDSYVDLDPGKIGDNHYDYRRVMNGIVQETDDGDIRWVEYSEDLRDGDSELHINQQAAILQTWDVVEMFFKAGHQDPTDPYGGTL